uniref:Putative ovule protein n=1 Tax=Solanum chacoense TaxID=4108 RepID=A0A0V0HXJ9_SOLCH
MQMVFQRRFLLCLDVVISSGQQPVVGFHHSSDRFIFFQLQVAFSMCSVIFLEGSSKRNILSFIAKTLRLPATFQVLHAHLLTSFRVGVLVSCDEIRNLPTRHLLKRSFSDTVVSPVMLMLLFVVCKCVFFDASVAHLFVLQTSLKDPVILLVVAVWGGSASFVVYMNFAILWAILLHPLL